MESKSNENRDEAPDEAQATPDTIEFKEFRDYCLITFQPHLMEMDWTGVDAGTCEVIEKLQAAKHNRVVIDLSKMPMINSGLIAALVRIWKATQQRNGLFSVVSPNDTVTEVLKISGLWKLWSVAADHEEATYDIGVSKVAIVERREQRTLTVLTLFCAVVSALTLVPIFLGQESFKGINVQTAAWLLSLAGCAFGLLAVIKDRGIARVVSVMALLVTIGVVATLWFREHPFYFRETEAMYRNK